MLYRTMLLLVLLSVAGCSMGFFLPRPGPGLGKKTEKQNGSDAIVIENTDKDNSRLPFSPIMPPKTCPGKRSCLGRCTNTRQMENITAKQTSFGCFCDPECNTIFHDCCADYERFCQENATQSSAIKWRCIMVARQNFGIWMINKCAQGWPHDEVRSKCERHSMKIGFRNPTLIVDEFSNTFRNHHCARCNNVQRFTCLRLEMNNNSSHNITTRRSRLSIKDLRSDVVDECQEIRVNHSSQFGLRYCYKIKSSCKDAYNSTPAARKCLEGKTGLVSFKSKTYKNFYCLKCNHRYSFGFVPAKVQCGPNVNVDSRFNFAALFGHPPASLYTDTSRCSSGFFYDATARRCRKLLTISDLNSNHSSLLVKYAIQLHYTRNQKSRCFMYNPSKRKKVVVLGQLLNQFNNEFMRRINLNSQKTNWTLSNIFNNVESTNYITIMFQILAIKSEVNETKLLSFVKDLKLRQLSFLYNDLNASSVCSYSLNATSSRRMNCLGNENQSNIAIAMDKVLIFDNGTLFYKDTQDDLDAGEYVLYKHHTQTRLAVCKKTTPSHCKYLLKSDSNWKIFPNRSIYNNVTNTWFEFGEYSIIDGVAWLCLTNELSSRHSKRDESKTIHETVLRYGSLFCFLISILALVLLLFVYAVTPSLRNLPGKNLMLLCGVLALAQFLWLLQEPAFPFPKVCIALSIVLHFLFLALFTCATSIAVLAFLNFRAIAKGKLGQSNDGKVFLWYALFSLGSPCVWLSVFLLLDFLGIFMLDYGKVKGQCWLGNIQGLYVSLVTPMFTLLCVNFTLLLATINMIRKCSLAGQKLAKSTKATLNRTHIWIYIRMASLMGFTWLLGVFQIVFPRVIVFEYLFVFVNGLQGFYIGLAFLCTDNVRKILARRMKSVSGKTLSSSN